MDAGKRSPLLEALCILSFAGNGIAILLYLTATILNRAAREWIREWSSLYDVSPLTPLYFLTYTFLYLVSFSGVLLMWRLNKKGFFIYLGSQISILLLPAFWMENAILSSVAVIFTLLFLFLYALAVFGKKSHSLDP